VLGWPIEDNDRYKYELSTKAGRPDITFLPESGGTIFIEAKKFGVIKELQQARFTIAGTITPGQMALPGMSVDRTEEEQQAINYAFENGGTWAILTNFEKLRLFNARRDWLVLSFESPSAYLRDFDLLWQLAYPNILQGSLDALSNQRHTEEVDTVYLEFINEWRERLARDVLSNPKKNSWVFDDNSEVNLRVLRDVVQRFLDRLVVVRFAEDHLVIPPGTLYNLYELRKNNPYTFSMDEFVDRLFRQFDEAHNSALFSPGIVDDAVFSDNELIKLIEKLYEARYRAMPADILGNTYEQYLGKTLVLDGKTVVTRDNLETRKKQGSYYTPQVIVRYIVDNSLGRYLYGTENGKPEGKPVEGEHRKTSAEIGDLRVLDAACGSGSFLIYAYYVLAGFYEKEQERLKTDIEQRVNELAHNGLTEMEIFLKTATLRNQLEEINDYPRLILEKHLYGVDLDAQAAEIAVVNLMMRGMERQRKHKRLPLILNQNVKSGNSLIGLLPNDPRLLQHSEKIVRIFQLRSQLTNPQYDDQHNRIISELEALTASLYEIFAPEFTLSFHDVERIRPFHWGIEFPEVFFDEAGTPLSNPGFTIILGNPPWEILKPDLREFYAQFDPAIESKLNRKEADLRISQLETSDPKRRAQWDAVMRAVTDFASYIRDSTDYTRQGKGDTATHKLFLERAFTLLQNGGRLGYIVPSGIYTDLGTKELREMLLTEGNIQYLFSFSNERFFFPGVHHSYKFTLLGAQKGISGNGFWATFRFNPRVAVKPDDLPKFLGDLDNLIYIPKESIQKFSPNSLSIMEFQTQRDHEITEKIYSDHPLLGDVASTGWNIKFTNELHMTNDRDLFNVSQRGLPLYEGKMIHQYDAFYASPQFWVDEQTATQRLNNKNGSGSEHLLARVGVRAIARSTDERTLIAAILPPKVFCGNSILVVRDNGLETRNKLFLVSLLNSFVLDYILRQKVAANVNMFYLQQLPVPRLGTGQPHFDAVVSRVAKLVCVRPEFKELWETATNSPWNETNRIIQPDELDHIKDEVDAIVAHLYGLTRSEFDYILATFPVAFPSSGIGSGKRSALLDTYDTFTAEFA
jgi:hypothetical protein